MPMKIFTVIRSVVAWERCYVTAETEKEAKQKAAAQDAWKMFDFDPGECIVSRSKDSVMLNRDYDSMQP